METEQQTPILDYNESTRVVNPLDALAGKGKRLGNYLIDFVMIFILYATIIFTTAVILTVVSPESITGFESSMESLGSVYILILMFFYYAFMETVFGRTIGKMITGTRVVDEEGNKPTLKAAMLRTLSRFVPFEGFSLLANSRAWHDQWTDTYVIDKNQT